jgi:hypothetical protein
MGIQRVGQAPQNSWLRVRERAVKIENCGSDHHVISIACGSLRERRGLPQLNLKQATETSDAVKTGAGIVINKNPAKTAVAEDSPALFGNVIRRFSQLCDLRESRGASW